jgi:hypothetical protein
VRIYGYEWGIFDRRKGSAVMRSKDRARTFGSYAEMIKEVKRRNKAAKDPERFCPLPLELMGSDPEAFYDRDDEEEYW